MCLLVPDLGHISERRLMAHPIKVSTRSRVRGAARAVTDLSISASPPCPEDTEHSALSSRRKSHLLLK